MAYLHFSCWTFSNAWKSKEKERQMNNIQLVVTHFLSPWEENRGGENSRWEENSNITTKASWGGALEARVIGVLVFGRRFSSVYRYQRIYIARKNAPGLSGALWCASTYSFRRKLKIQLTLSGELVEAVSERNWGQAKVVDLPSISKTKVDGLTWDSR